MSDRGDLPGLGGALCSDHGRSRRAQSPASGFENVTRDSQLKAVSRPKMNRIITMTNARTVIESRISSLRVGMTIFLSSAITWRTNRPMARNGFEDPDPWPSPLTGVDGAFWLEFTSGLSDLLVGLAHPAGTSRPEGQGRQDSNLQPAVLETAALPIAPLPFARRTSRGPAPSGGGRRFAPTISIQASGARCESAPIRSQAHSRTTDHPAPPRPARSQPCGPARDPARACPAQTVGRSGICAPPLTRWRGDHRRCPADS